MHTQPNTRQDDDPEAADATEEARRDLGEMNDLLAIVAHELRNPLHALSLQVSVARMAAEAQGQTDTLARILKAQQTLERYTDRVTILLDLVTRQGQSYPASARAVTLDRLLGDVVDNLAAEAAYFNVGLTFHAQGDCQAVVDPLLVEQIAENLLLNAFKHASCSTVNVKLMCADGWAVLDIADNGRGIDPQDQERIFRKFGVSSHSGRGSGTGLGLWIVRRLSQALAGKVSLVSAPGHGCTFTVRFPLSQPAPPTIS